MAKEIGDLLDYADMDLDSPFWARDKALAVVGYIAKHELDSVPAEIKAARH